MSNPDNYTVGWLCAILTEYVAAQAFLDEVHPDAAVRRNDNNQYKLGRIGQHNVVIAVLPDAEYGTASAARAAADMLGTFRYIRIGLMVGIGGGAPSDDNDIRLGDIVVSSPRDGRGGVFQYDFGETIQNQTFRNRRFLDQPPTVIRSAVVGIQAKYETEGHQLREAVEAALNKNPRLRRKYQCPSQSTDRLFKPNVTHNDYCTSSSCGRPSDKNTHNPTTVVDEKYLVHRRKRTEHEDNPAIYYGTIASANQLMKDATIRDELAAEQNVLCFEMEAAGLMNHFPCLVIRGICDYADTHINKQWQGYAAMTAAAYAKDLLGVLLPTDVEAQRAIKDTVDNMNTTLGSMNQDVKNLRTIIATQQDEAILNWLTSNNHPLQHSRFRDMRHKGTGRWFLTSAEFRSWQEARGKTLFCPGNAGVGKSLMASIVIDHLLSTRSDANTGVAFLYLDHAKKQEQTVNNLLAALLKQLAFSGKAVDDSVKELWHNRDKRPTPTLADLSNALNFIVKKLESVFFIVDALDECESAKCRKALMGELLKLQLLFKVNIFATARPDPKIVQTFQEQPPIMIEIISSAEDIDNYVSDQLQDVFPAGIKENRDLLDQAKEDIIKTSKGIFIKAYFNMKLLHDKDVSSAEELRQALWEINQDQGASDHKETGLHEDTYVKIWGQIQLRHGGVGRRILLWTTCAPGKMSSGELRDILSVETSAISPRQPSTVSIERVLSTSLGLVTIDAATDCVRFTHITTHQYFTQNKETYFPDADIEMMRICLTTLSTRNLDYNRERFTDGKPHPFYMYAASNWGHHARKSRETPDCVELVVNFFKKGDRVSTSGKVLVSSIDFPDKYSYCDDSAVIGRIAGMNIGLVRALHLVAFFGLQGVFRRLAELGQSRVRGFLTRKFKKQLSQKATEYHMTPLHFAVIGGHQGLVKLLVEHGAAVNKEDLYWRTPRALAEACGSQEMAKFLKENGGKMMVEDKKEKAWKYAMLYFGSFPRISL